LTGDLPSFTPATTRNNDLSAQSNNNSASGDFVEIRGDIVQSETSQFTFPEGRSACTAIACEAAIQLLSSLSSSASNNRSENISPEFITKVIQDGIQIYNESNNQNRQVEHLAVDEILPFVDRFLSMIQKTSDISIQALLTNPECFTSMFDQAREGQVYI
jgi:hypothetical protein